MAQHTARCAFLLDDLEFEQLSTAEGWEVGTVQNWEWVKMHETLGGHYIDVGPGERVLLGQDLAEVELEWRKPSIVCTASERGASGGGTPWMLVPRTIPPMRYEHRNKPPTVRHGYLNDPRPSAPTSDFAGPITLKDGESMLLDYGELLCAYPRIEVSGHGKVRITYAECCRYPNKKKGNRNEVANKEVGGLADEILPGSEPHIFEPLWWRCYRYALLEVEGEATFHRVDAIETGYPLAIESTFDADDPWVKNLWDVSVRTAARCAGETYFDCPYYEQLQYAADTRIQALIGYYLGTDRALTRAANRSFEWSTLESGLTQSRYPSRQVQVIPPFSLWWIVMLGDQKLYDRAGMGSFEQGSRSERITNAFFDLMNYPEEAFWSFADWVPTWRGGVPPLGVRSTVHRLTEAYGRLIALPSMFEFCTPEDAGYKAYIEQEKKRFLEFQKIDGLVREEDEHPSEHAESLYRLCQLELGDEPDPWPFSALERSNAAKCTYYFSYYKHLAMRPDDYLAQLGPWKEMIEDGLTTFAENPEPTRSDCHAWSAHPILGFFQIVAGVKSTSTGWRSCRIEPRPGRLRKFEAKIAHLDGTLRVHYEAGKLKIESPVPYELVWKGKSEQLPSGSASFS
jgi:hypothetical protein